jgi:hypothetical protein
LRYDDTNTAATILTTIPLLFPKVKTVKCYERWVRPPPTISIPIFQENLKKWKNIRIIIDHPDLNLTTRFLESTAYNILKDLEINLKIIVCVVNPPI